MTEKVFLFEQPIPLNDIAEVWRGEYRATRYLETLNVQDLSTRLFDIAQNLMKFDEKIGKYKPIFNVGPDGIYRPVKNLDWLKMAVEVYEEFGIRNIQIPKFESPAYNPECEKRLSLSNWANRSDLIEASKPPLDRYEVPRTVFRYSLKKYNEGLLNLGKIRLVPASSYKDRTLLNRAQSDYETVMEVNELGGHFEVDDFFTVCFSSIYSFRMYCEFNTDSCVVVEDLPEFQKRFNQAIKDFNLDSHQLRIAKVITCPVFYYDPLIIEKPTTTDEIRLSKTFRFAYQHEFRLVILPTRPQPLEAFFLYLGPLHDIAKIVCDN